MRFMEPTAIEHLLERIATEIRPKLDRFVYEGGYDCCGCSSYEQIVDDIEKLIREEARPRG